MLTKALVEIYIHRLLCNVTNMILFPSEVSISGWLYLGRSYDFLRVTTVPKAMNVSCGLEYVAPLWEESLLPVRHR